MGQVPGLGATQRPAAMQDWIDRADLFLAEMNRPELVAHGLLLPDDRFLPVVTYPLITMYPAADPEPLLAGAEEARGDHPRAVYVHLPFCRFSCNYCHWIKRIQPPAEFVDAYLDVLLAEIDVTRRWLGVDRIRASSVLFGGGTPTYLTAAQLTRLLDGFRERVDLSRCPQVSVEAEPTSILGDEGFEKLSVLVARGVNRISLGVQSFEDRVLAGMGRHHSAQDAWDAIEQCRRAGIDSVSIDLIYGCMDQTFEDWVHTMQTALASGADAWQLYRLRVERHGDIQGRVADQFSKERDRFADLRDITRMKAAGILFSEENGHRQHFTRIFATKRSHVTQYMWNYCCELTDVVGLGISSWSNHGRAFLLNIASDFGRHAEMVRAGRVPVDRGLVRCLETDARRSLITPLKNDRVYKSRFRARTGLDLNEHFGPDLNRLADFGLVVEDDVSFALTPRGRFFADETVMQLFQRRFLPYPELAHALTPP